jgi:hypothetical protein
MVQANQLRELVEQTKNALPEDHEAFVMILTRALALLEMSHQNLADEMRLSRTSIGRWVSGKNLPVKAIRGPILRWIMKQAEQKASQIEAEDS